MGQRTKRLAIATLFGVAIFVTKTFVPSPIDKMFIVVQALLLALGALLIRKMGATCVAVVGGVLSALWRTALAPFTLLFSLMYGLFVDGLFFLFKVDIVDGRVKSGRLVTAMTLSTMLVGLSSYYATVSLMGLIQRNLLLEVSILIIGTISGTIAGYFASIIWNKYLKNAKF